MTEPSSRPAQDGPTASTDQVRAHEAHLLELPALLGFAGGRDARRAETLLAGCSLCRAEWPLLQRTVRTIRQLPPDAFLGAGVDDAELLARRVLRRRRRRQAAARLGAGNTVPS